MRKYNTLQQYVKNIPKGNFSKFQKDLAYLIGLAQLDDYNDIQLGFVRKRK